MRGVTGMFMIGEIFGLKKKFLKEHFIECYASEFEKLLQIQQSITLAREKRIDHVDLDVSVKKFLIDFKTFVGCGRQTSEQFPYWDNFLRLLQLLRNLFHSDRQSL